MSAIHDLGLELFMALSLAAASAAGEEASWHWRSSASSRTVAVQAVADVRGPMRYSEQRWLAALRRSGVAPGHARRIFLTSSGTPYVPLAAERRRILALRQDLVIAGQVAFLEAKRNGTELAALIGRPPTVAELHAAHLLGAAGAACLAIGATASPGQPAARCVPDAHSQLPELYAQARRSLSAGDLIRVLEAQASHHAILAATENGVRHSRSVPAARPAVGAWTVAVDATR